MRRARRGPRIRVNPQLQLRCAPFLRIVPRIGFVLSTGSVDEDATLGSEGYSTRAGEMSSRLTSPLLPGPFGALFLSAAVPRSRTPTRGFRRAGFVRARIGYRGSSL